MMKLLKYNFRESSRLLAPLLIVLFVLNMFPDVILDKLNNGWIAIIYGLTNAAILITLVVHLGRSFSKEFNEDRRFLTFTLPINGSKFILAKLINTTLWLIILWAIFILDGLVIAIRHGELDLSNFNFEFLNMDLKTIILTSIILIMIILIGYMYIMLSGYFTETLTKLIYRGKSGFIQTLIIIILWIIQLRICVGITEFIASKLPLYYNFITGNFGVQRGAIEVNLYMMQGNIDGGYINLTAMIILALISTVYFFGMAYLIDNKIDL